MLVRRLSLVMGTVSLGHPRSAVLVVLEAGSNHHHGQSTGEHSIDLGRDLITIGAQQCLVALARQERSECGREASVDKVVQTDKEGSRTDNRSADNDHMPFHKEREDDADDNASNNEDGTTSAVRDDTIRAPRENKDGQVKASNGADCCKSKAPEAQKETASQDSGRASNTEIDPLCVGAVSIGWLSVPESDPSECAEDVETSEEERDLEELVAKERKQESSDHQHDGHNSSADSDLEEFTVFASGVGCLDIDIWGCCEDGCEEAKNEGQEGHGPGL